MNKVYRYLIVIWLILFGLITAKSQSCYSGTITFSTQAQIDEFPALNPGCVSINANVIIAESASGGITNLDSLAQVTSINGYLNIGKNGSNGNSALSSLNGLHNLNSIGGGLFLYNNDNLSDLSALAGLTSIPGDFIVESNDFLTNLSGLSAVTSVSGQVYFKNNTSLISLTGLEGLTTVSNLFFIDNNDALTSVDGLTNLSSIGAGLFIYYNNTLSNLTALANLANVGGPLKIIDNDFLSSLYGIHNISHTSIDDLNLLGNAFLSECDVTSICDYLDIPTSFAIISANTTPCNTRAEVEGECTALGLTPQWMSSFSVSVDGPSLIVNWTDSEVGKEIMYEVQRSMDGNQFVSVAQQKSLAGGSYEYVDHQYHDGDNYYRIKKYINGREVGVSSTGHIKLRREKESGWSIMQTISDSELIVESKRPGNFQVHIYSVSGSRMESVVIKPGTNKININNYPSGVYHIVDERKVTQKSFIKE